MAHRRPKVPFARQNVSAAFPLCLQSEAVLSEWYCPVPETPRDARMYGMKNPAAKGRDQVRVGRAYFS